MAKPGDLFVGATEFFSVLLPGASLTFLLWRVEAKLCVDVLGLRDLGSNEGYGAFLLCSYLLGHLVDLTGASILDWLYDQTFARWRRRAVRHWHGERAKRHGRQWQKARDEAKGKFPYWPLQGWWAARHHFHLTEAAASREHESPAWSYLGFGERYDPLGEAANRLAQQDMPPGDNKHQWCRTWVQMNSPSSYLEVERTQANSKFFRGMVVVACAAFFLVPLLHSQDQHLSRIVCLAVALVSFYRFSDLRWKAVQQVYRAFIAIKRQGPVTRPAPDEHES